jgi:uncharacterized protein (DUF608 family)
VQDEDFARQCRALYQKGLEIMDRHLWTGHYYRIYNDPEKSLSSDLLMPNQLDGEWIGRLHGVLVLPPDRLNPIVASIKEFACDEILGAWSFTKAEQCPLGIAGRQSRADLPYRMYFPQEISMLGMSLYSAGEKEAGLKMLYRNWFNMSCRYRYAWDLPNMVSPMTGERNAGTEYYQNLVLWTAPAILAGQDLKSYCQPGALISRILRAASQAN